MRMIMLAAALVALVVPSEAAQKNNDMMSHSGKCREMVGKEVGEGEMKTTVNRTMFQLWSDCMMGMSHAHPRS
jgi:hypothetical protein